MNVNAQKGIENPGGDGVAADFFLGSTRTLCRRLLGMNLCRRMPDGRVERWPITEVEAYDGFQDRASHAHRGATPRNRIMFDTGGRWYVYLCYGVHWLLNITAGPADYPAAILVRGAGAINGPGRLTRALQVDNALNELPVDPQSGLWIENGGTVVPRKSIRQTPRIGIDSAGPIWSQKPWRYLWVDAP